MPTWKDISPEELARLKKMAQKEINVYEIEGRIKHGQLWSGHLERAKRVIEIMNIGNCSEITKCSKSKYRNQKTRGFHSKKEADRYDELVMMQKCGKISELSYQIPFLLQPGFRDKEGVYHRPINYIADFVYIQDGKEVCEDVKSKATMTQVYRIKKKLLLFKYPDINFLET